MPVIQVNMDRNTYLELVSLANMTKQDFDGIFTDSLLVYMWLLKMRIEGKQVTVKTTDNHGTPFGGVR